LIRKILLTREPEVAEYPKELASTSDFSPQAKPCLGRGRIVLDYRFYDLGAV
jgi:hypothetical protein